MNNNPHSSVLRIRRMINITYRTGLIMATKVDLLPWDYFVFFNSSRFQGWQLKIYNLK